MTFNKTPSLMGRPFGVAPKVEKDEQGHGWFVRKGVECCARCGCARTDPRAAEPCQGPTMLDPGRTSGLPT